jgi:anti-sigma factor RsiW
VDENVMIPNPSLHWNEIVAAYADGEFEGRDDLALLKQRVEEWLRRHPEAHAELAEYRRLKQLWQETAPPEPAPEAWRQVLEVLRTAPASAPTSRVTWRRMAVFAAGLAACLALVAVGWRREPPASDPPALAHTEEEQEILSVASMDEVEILRVEGADTSTLVTGALPLQGSMELAAPGEVTITSVQPDARDQMVPMIRIGGGRPMIWARLDTEE